MIALPSEPVPPALAESPLAGPAHEPSLVTDDEAAAGRLRDLIAIHRAAMATHVDHLHELSVVFAGRPARLRVVGRALAATMADAFGHLAATNRTPPALTIDLWDESLTGVSADAVEDVNLGRTWLVGGGLLTSACQGRVVRHQLPHTVAWLDRQAQAIVGAVTSADELSLYERGKPLHYVLSLWHNDRHALVTHGALVARNRRGVLLAGVGGSGKSTTAVACADAGFALLGDDCIAVERGPDGRFVGHSVYGAPWLDEASLTRLPRFGPHAVFGTRPGEDKALVQVHRAGHAVLEAAADIVAIGLPRITGATRTTVSAASAADAMRALGPSSILLFAPSPGAEGLRHLRSLVDRVPAYWIDLGTSLADAPAAVTHVLDVAERVSAAPS